MAAEVNGDGRASNPGGVYRHPDTGQELVTQATAKFGNPQADAIVRLGFVYVGPADAEKSVPAPDPYAVPEADTTPGQKSVAELETELAAARGREAAASKAQRSKSGLLDQSAVKAAEEAAAPQEEKESK